MSPASSPPRTFKSAAAFRAWLARNHRSANELLVRLYRVHATERGLGYGAALDEALCYGWIDGVRRRYDADSYLIRFTPRKPRSIWSNVNVAHVHRLQAEGRMHPAGLAAFAARDESRTGVYSFERAVAVLDPAFEKCFRANRKAWRHFEQAAPSYRRVATHWVMSAKRQETRQRRLGVLIDCSATGLRIPPLRLD